MTRTNPIEPDVPQNADTSHTEATAPALTAFAPLQTLADQLATLEQRLVGHTESADPFTVKRARRMLKKLREFEPSVTFIGQVKAGKTTLVNGLIGWPDLLPADVNPWTSVVTSMHLGAHHRRGGPRSDFRFFSEEEWLNLARQGGRIGEIARRAGAADEMAKVQAQLADMRERSRMRLGRKFELLMGQTHSYETLNPDLIQRYVCMGDDFWDGTDVSREHGRFADITKTADLWFTNQQLPVSLCIQDTPGVNDTFMIREQITLNALRASRLCVVVLSAQQALSSVDLGLIRLIANVKARDIVIFVNRIDELSDPVNDVPQVRASIQETMAKHDGPKDVEVIFGSAYWGQHAVENTLHHLSRDSADMLMAWAKAHLSAKDVKSDPRDLIWSLSGLPVLGRAITERVEQGVGKALIEEIENNLRNMQSGINAIDQTRTVLNANAAALAQVQDTLSSNFDAIKCRTVHDLEEALVKAQAVFDARAQSARRSFLDRATRDLIKHLDKYGDEVVWSYDPVGLRLLLRSAYQVYARAAGNAAQTQFRCAAVDMTHALQTALNLSDNVAKIEAPPVPVSDAPVALAETIALDLKGNWWTRFWRNRRGYDAFAEDFATLIHEETTPIPAKLRTEYVDAYADTLRRALAHFIDDQRDLILGSVGQIGQGQPLAAPSPRFRAGQGG